MFDIDDVDSMVSLILTDMDEAIVDQCKSSNEADDSEDMAWYDGVEWGLHIAKSIVSRNFFGFASGFESGDNDAIN